MRLLRAGHRALVGMIISITALFAPALVAQTTVIRTYEIPGSGFAWLTGGGGASFNARSGGQTFTSPGTPQYLTQFSFWAICPTSLVLLWRV